MGLGSGLRGSTKMLHGPLALGLGARGISTTTAPSASDPFWPQVSLAMPLLTDASDKSTSALSFTNTAVTFSGPAFNQVSSASFNGTTGKLVCGTPGNAANVGIGNFTVDGYVLLNNNSAVHHLFDSRTSTGDGTGIALFTLSNGHLTYACSADVDSGVVVTPNVFHHWALVRSGFSTMSMYIDGILAGATTTLTNALTDTTQIQIGHDTATNFMSGNAQWVRFTRGARWVTNFTPPTTFPTQ